MGQLPHLDTDCLMERVYARLGRRYWLTFPVLNGGMSMFVAILAVGIVALYYRPAVGDAIAAMVVAAVVTGFVVTIGSLPIKRDLHRILAWREQREHSPEETIETWRIGTSATLRLYRRNSLWINVTTAVPALLFATFLWDLGLAEFAAMAFAGGIALVYGTFIGYTIAENVARPVLAEIAKELPDDFEFRRTGLPLSVRLRVGLPLYTTLTGVIVAGALGRREGAADLAITVVVSVAVGLVLSGELVALLSRNITRPIDDVRAALKQIGDGDFEARTLVRTDDELGELAHDVNQMAAGLAERERMRETFSTYLDREVAQIILSGQFPESGLEIDVSILFCDMRGFTAYSEQASAPEVVATLNQLFSAIVPVIDEHGGHVDKFMGDGLLAVFGAPEFYADHADRAVAAGLDIADAVARTGLPLSVGVGVNTGRVVAGSIGGAGRLNFSVIGDAVNVAARVEAATRETGDDLLVTCATRDALTRDWRVESRGELTLKGKSAPLELLSISAVEGVEEPEPLTGTRTGSSQAG